MTVEATEQAPAGHASGVRTGRSVAIGAVLGLDALGYSVAIASVVFAGPLYFALGLGALIFMLSTVVIGLVLAWRSAFPGAAGLAQDASIPVLAPAMIAAATLVDGPPDARLATALAVMATATLLTGGALFLIGRFRLGRVARVVPFPVAAGFPASGGWLLVAAGLSISTEAIDLSGLRHHIATQGIPLNLTLELALLIGFFVCRRFLPGAVSVLVPIAGATCLFYLGLVANGYTLADARAAGLLPSMQGLAASLPDLSYLAQIHWPVILGVGATIAAVVLVNIFGFILNTGAVELAVGSDVDMDREAMVTGSSNLLIGVFGGAAGYISASGTLLAHALGGDSRLLGLSFGVMTLIGSFFAAQIVAHLPVFVAGGFVVFIGATMLERWVLDTRSRLPRRDWMIIVVILLTTIFVSIIAAIAVGTAIALLIFVMTYARMPVVRFQSPGTARRSTVDRSAGEEAILTQQGARIHVIAVQGYLFFGSVEQLLAQARQRIGRHPPLSTLVVDFRHISGLDSAACAAVAKLGYLAESNGFAIMLAAVPGDVLDIMQRWGIAFSGDTPFNYAEDLDQALEQAEDRLIDAFAADMAQFRKTGLLDRLNSFDARGADLFAMMRPMDLKKGDVLITAGTTTSDIFFVERGRVSVWIGGGGEARMRVRSMRQGAVVGEAARYLGGMRTADVIVEEPSLIYRLPDHVMDGMERNDPALAAVLHRFLATSLSEKISQSNNLLTEIQK